MRQRHDQGEAEGFRTLNDLKGGTLDADLATNFVLPSDGTPAIVIHRSAGAKNLRMPTGSLSQKGKLVYVVAAGAGAITIQASDGTALTSATVVAANTAALLIGTGDAAMAGSWVALKQGT